MRPESLDTRSPIQDTNAVAPASDAPLTDAKENAPGHPLVVVGDGWLAWQTVQAACNQTSQIAWIRHTTHTNTPRPNNPQRFAQLLRRSLRQPIESSVIRSAEGDRHTLDLWQQARQQATPDCDEEIPAQVEVLFGAPRFTGRNRLEVNGRTLTFRRAILALEPLAVEPEIEGLSDCGYRTPATIGELLAPPRCVAVLGDSGEACEWAQSLARLGSDVHLIVPGPGILPEEDPEAAALIHAQLECERVRLHVLGSPVVEPMGRRKAIVLGDGSQREKVLVDEILVCSPRRWQLDAFDFSAGRIETWRGQPIVGRRLQTSNSRVLAVGPLAGEAGSDASCGEAMVEVAVANALQPIPWAWLYRRFDVRWAPRVVRTDPQLVHVGMSVAEISARREQLHVEGEASMDDVLPGVPGKWRMLKVAVDRQTGNLEGVTAVATDPTPWIVPLTLLATQRLSWSALAAVIGCGPSHLDVLKRIATRLQMLIPPRWKRLREQFIACGTRFCRWISGK